MRDVSSLVRDPVMSKKSGTRCQVPAFLVRILHDPGREGPEGGPDLDKAVTPER